MSRVVITDILPGTEATSSSVNTTITSWNNAGAAGAIGGNNFREEGIDRRSLSFDAQAIQGHASAYADALFASNDSSGPVTAAAYTVITLGAADVVVGPSIAGPSGFAKFIIRASVAFSADVYCLVECALATGPAAIGPWTPILPTVQKFQTNELRLGDGIPYCVGTFTAVTTISGSTSGDYYAVVFKAAPGNVAFSHGTLYMERYDK